MRITKYGHSCLLVERSDTRLLVDPGGFSRGFEQLTGLAAVLVTHQHADHVDVDRLRPLLDANPQARLLCDPDTAEQLGGANVPRQVEVVRGGDRLTVGDLPVHAVGEQHAVIHPDLPRITNTGYRIGDRLFHPGDALTVPEDDVEILALPCVAPWMKVAETIDYLRAVAPRLAVPIHDAITAAPQLYDGMLGRLGPDGTEYRRIDDEPLEV